MRHVTGLARSRDRAQILLTAAEAFPAFERAVLAARTEIWASFRIFDPATRLRSPEARAVGETWWDLVVHALGRGVTIHLAISDFDPVARPSLHRGTWSAIRRLRAAAEAAGPAAAPLHLCAAMHPATVGWLARATFWAPAAVALRRTARWLNAQPPEVREAALRDMPGLRGCLKVRADGTVRARWRALPPLRPATHHQKLAVFDRRLLYIGGLDLDERRWDTPDHDRPGEETWQDLQLLVEGPVALEAQAHLESFLAVTAGEAEPPPQRRLLRTLSRPRARGFATLSPEPVAQEILDAHAMLAARAERMIYLETQFFRDRGLARLLARAGRETPELSLLLVLPAAPEEVAFRGGWGPDTLWGEFLQARCLRMLEEAYGPRLFVAGMAQPRRTPHRPPAGPQAAGPEGRGGPEEFGVPPLPGAEGRDRLRGAPLVYIHSKVSIFDDAAIMSSANLNGRSLRWDTEAGVLLSDPRDVRELRDRVMGHWLPEGADARFFDPAQAVTMWRLLGLRNALLPPDRRDGFVLPYDRAAAERIGRALPGLPESLV